MENILTFEDISYKYKGAVGGTMAVMNASATFSTGRIYAIVGKSGSGKTTLMSLAAGLDVSSKGKVVFKGRSLESIDRDIYRSRNIGMIFQSYNLLPQFTALENVMLSLELSNYPVKYRKNRALELLNKMDINEEKASRKVLKLSGGEQQRVAIARALGPNPEVILADEPTGNLDTTTGDVVLQYLIKLAHDEDKCVIVITHSKDIAKMTDHTYEMVDGLLRS